MLQFNHENKEYHLPQDWKEVSFRTFIRVSKIRETNEVIPLPDEMLLTALLEAFCDVPAGEFDDLIYEQLITLSAELQHFNEAPPKTENTIWDIDGTIYSYHKNPYQYTAGEVSDIRQIEAQKGNNYDYLIKIAAIMIRPAVMSISEAGNSYYKLIKRHSADTEQREAVISNMKAYEVMTVIGFFLNGLRR